MFSLLPALRTAMWAMLAGVLVAGCGSNEESVSVSHARHGLVYPPRQGIEFVEYAADGSVLQRSTPTDADGRFAFERPVSGMRIAAVVERPLQRPEIFSARFARTYQDIVVTPLTTVFDQWIESGRGRTEAEQRILGTIDGAGCARLDPPAMRAALYADTAATTLIPTKHLLHAWSAHLRALRAIGLGLEAVEETVAIPHRLDVLRKQCALARRLLDPVWLSGAYVAAAERLALDSPALLYWIRWPSATLVDEVLALLDNEMRVREHPQLEPLFSPAVQAWRDRQTSVAQELLLALLIGNSQSVAGPMRLSDSAVERTAYRRGAGYGLTPEGRVVEKRREVVRFAAASGEGGAFRLRNDGPSAARVVLDIADHLPIDLPSIVRAVLAAPFLTSEPLYMRAWRYVVAATWHYVPVSESHFLHDPPLFLRSVGAGFCDDRASILAFLWKAMGYDAKIWGIEGHVVPEVFDGQRWRMFDPDLGVYYFRRDGEVASFADLQGDASLITNPTAPIYRNTTYADVVYSAGIAELYASWWNNWPAWQMATPLPPPLPTELIIPPGAVLQLAAPERLYPIATIDRGYVLKTARLQLWLPQGFRGRVPLPFAIADVDGEGTVNILARDVDVRAMDVAELVNTYYRALPSAAERCHS